MQNLYNETPANLAFKPVNLIYENFMKESKLFLGNIGSYKDAMFLIGNNIHAICSVLKDFLIPQSTELIYDHLIISIDDNEAADILNDFNKVIDFIEKNMDLGHSVLVHCHAGCSRSASFVIAYLMKKNQWCFEKTYMFVKNKRPQVYPNSGFMRQLRIFEKKLIEEKAKEEKLLEKKEEEKKLIKKIEEDIEKKEEDIIKEEEVIEKKEEIKPKEDIENKT